MTINKFTPMRKMLAAYPPLIHKMIERNPRFVFLRMPVPPSECGYCITVAQVAQVAGENEADFVAFLKNEIQKIEIQYKY